MISPGNPDLSYIFLLADWPGHALIIPAEGNIEQKCMGTCLKPEP